MTTGKPIKETFQGNSLYIAPRFTKRLLDCLAFPYKPTLYRMQIDFKEFCLSFLEKQRQIYNEIW